MTTRTLLEPAFILHNRAFRDTSLILHCFTLNHGIVSVLARGVRKPRSKLAGILLPFTPLLISFAGKSELQNLSTAEPICCSYDFRRNLLPIGLYINELLDKLLHKHDPHPELFHIYQETLKKLQEPLNTSFEQQKILRSFEINLLRQIGYGLQLNTDVAGNPIMDEAFYDFAFGHGFSRIETSQADPQLPSGRVFAGGSLVALRDNRLILPQEFRDAKHLLRIALTHLLGNKTITARELLVNNQDILYK